MTRFRASIVFATIILLAVGSAALPAAAQYVYTPIPGPSGNSSVQVTGVDDTGTVVGQYQGPDGHVHGFLWTGGTNYTTFDFNGAGVVGTFPTGINNAGVIVGSWDDTSGFCHAFSGTIGNFTTLNIFGSPQTFANGINNKGEIVGAWEDVNSIIHGFTDINGTIASFDFPGSPVVTFPLAVNDFGQIVGSYTPSGSSASNPPQSFILSPNVSLSTLTPPSGSTTFDVGGIDDAGDIVGVALGSSTGNQFVLAGGGVDNFLTPFGFSSGFLFGLNSSQISSSGGDIVGNVNGEGFLGRGPSLLDPVQDMLDPFAPAVLNDMALATGPGLKGRAVKAVAADGVTEVVIRVPAQNAGDQFTITLFNDQATQSDSPSQDGALGNPGDTTFTQSQITVTAENVTVTAPDGSTSSVPFAFAVYRAPIDFVRQNASGADFSSRGCPYASSPAGFAAEASATPPTGPQAIAVGPPQTDDQLACRIVSLQIQDLTHSTSTKTRIAILRPLVVMIHGLWSSSTAWNNFSPLVQGENNVDKRFSIGRVSYDVLIGPLITTSDPAYPILKELAESNSLGFAFNAVLVQQQTYGWISKFKNGENPTHLPAAAVQADIVAHSMGGDIARTMALNSDFLGNSTYGQGTIHKLITIDTPHLGSQLAGLLLQPNEEGGCVESSFALLAGNFVFNTVSFINGTVPGAVGDLTPSSNALQTIANGGQHPIPSALIAGVYTSFGSLSPAKSALGIICSAAGDPIANDLTPTGWPAIFNPQGNDPNGGNNDGIVSETSQLAGLPASSQNGVFVFTGLVHSPSLPGHFSGLGFFGPSVLDPSPADPIPNQVIELLNTPITDPAFVLLNQGLVAVHMGNSIFQLIVPIGE